MDIAFRGLLQNYVMVYLDDINIFSKRRQEHLSQLIQLLEQCRKYGIFLNPKKSISTVIEGNLLGFVVSKHGIMI